MPTLPEILGQLGFITQDAVLLGLFLTAGIILVVRDWRFLILALLAQYVLAGLLLSRLVRPDIAIVKILIGAFICPILFLSVRQVSAVFSPILPFDQAVVTLSRNKFVRWWQRSSAAIILSIIGQDRRRQITSRFLFRLLAVLLMILVATTLSKTLILPGLSSSISAAVYWLILAGLAILTLTENPMKVGLGLFTTLTGFDLYYSTLESSLLLTGLWGAINLLIALVIGYLIVAQGGGLEEKL